MKLKRLIYRLGFRPSSRSVWYSPSLDWRYAAADYSRGMAEGIRSQEGPDGGRDTRNPG